MCERRLQDAPINCEMAMCERGCRMHPSIARWRCARARDASIAIDGCVSSAGRPAGCIHQLRDGDVLGARDPSIASDGCLSSPGRPAGCIHQLRVALCLYQAQEGCIHDGRRCACIRRRRKGSREDASIRIAGGARNAYEMGDMFTWDMHFPLVLNAMQLSGAGSRQPWWR